MKKNLIAAIALVVLYGCSSQPAKDEGKANVEERAPAATGAAPAQPSATTRPAQPAQVQLNPLKDPNNILSKRSVFFDYDSDALDETARGILDQNLQWLRDNPKARAELEGHCDTRGTIEYNLALGARRAKAVKDYLTGQGLAGERLSTISYGKELPLCQEETEECWARNRRVHSVVAGQ